MPRGSILRKTGQKWFVCAGLLAAGMVGVRAEDAKPAVTPDRIEDVPSTRIDPFPAFANFSWRAFIAINWPARLDAGSRGEPDRTKSFSDSGPRVWETFKARYDAFPRQEDGAPSEPSPWQNEPARNPCGPDFAGDRRVIASYDPYADFNQAGFAPGKLERPLVARNGTYVRYEVRINREEFDAILQHRFWRPEDAPTAESPVSFPVGSVAVKAGWKVLTEADPPRVRERYYVAENVPIVDVAASRAAGAVRCSRNDLALVGLHVAIKTRYRPQWIWSTFEHVDDVPPIGEGESREPDARDAGAPYAFNDPSLPQGEAAAREESLPAEPVSAARPPSLSPQPTQLVRKHPIRPQIMAINRAYWALPEVRGTVWSHYMLVANQWPTVIAPSGPDNDGRYFPGLRIEANTPAENYQSSEAYAPEFNLANVTMESFAQDQPASCMACHHAVANARGRDFVGILPGVN